MATVIDPFTPSATAPGNTGSFRMGLANGGFIFIHNESPIILQFAANNFAPVLVSAYTARAFSVPLSTDLVGWKGLAQVQDPSTAPIVKVFGEGYSPGEWTGGEGYWPLSRGILRQIRAVSLPMASFPFLGNLTMANDPVTPAPGNVQFLLPWVTLGLGPLGFFNYGHAIFHGGGAASRNVGACTIGVFATTFDNTPTPQQIAEIGRFRVSRAGKFGPASCSLLPRPTASYLTSSFILGASDKSIGVSVALLAGGGGMSIDFDMVASVYGDLGNLTPGPYGVFASQGGTLF